MNNKGFASFSAIGAILSVFFSLIIAYVIFGIFNAPQYADFGFICCFVVFNLIILVGLATLGGVIANVCGMPTLSACWTAAIIYTVIQFASTFAYLLTAPAMVGNQLYILGNLILAFILLLVVLPIISSGVRHSKDK